MNTTIKSIIKIKQPSKQTAIKVEDTIHSLIGLSYLKAYHTVSNTTAKK